MIRAADSSLRLVARTRQGLIADSPDQDGPTLRSIVGLVSFLGLTAETRSQLVSSQSELEEGRIFPGNAQGGFVTSAGLQKRGFVRLVSLPRQDAQTWKVRIHSRGREGEGREFLPFSTPLWTNLEL